MSTTVSPNSVSAAPVLASQSQRPGVRSVLFASATLTILAGVSIAPSLPGMLEAFAGVPNADVLVRLVLSITALAVAVSAPLAGLFADRVGRKPLLVFSLLLYALAGVSGFFAPSLPIILAGRVLLGVAVAGVMTSVSALIIDYFEGPRRATFLGLQSAFSGFGGVLFVPLGGLLAGLSWRTPFWIYAVALAIAPFAALVLREARRARPTVAPKRLENGQTDRSVRLLVTGIYALTLVSTLLYFMVPTQLPFYLERFDLGPSGTGLVIAASTLTSALASLGYARLRQRLSFSAVTVLALGMLSVGWVVIGTAGTLAPLVAGAMLGGVGAGFMVPNLNVWLSQIAPPERRGQVLSGLVTALFLGQFLSPLVLQPLIASVGLGAAFLWGGIASLLVAVLVMLGSRLRQVV